MIHYFTYGSNLHPVRLLDRIPSAKLTGTVKLDNHRLLFHKKGMDGSAKCNLSVTENSSHSIYGAIYEMDAEHKSILDKFEGKGSGYLDHQISLPYQGQSFECFTYLAQAEYIEDGLKPYHWYKELVVLGAKYLQFPQSYIYSINSVESSTDPDSNRNLKHEMLIQQIKNYG